jgi:hypothetical protein
MKWIDKDKLENGSKNRLINKEWPRNNFPFYLSTGFTGGYSHSTPSGLKLTPTG